MFCFRLILSRKKGSGRKLVWFKLSQWTYSNKCKEFFLWCVVQIIKEDTAHSSPLTWKRKGPEGEIILYNGPDPHIYLVVSYLDMYGWICVLMRGWRCGWLCGWTSDIKIYIPIFPHRSILNLNIGWERFQTIVTSIIHANGQDGLVPKSSSSIPTSMVAVFQGHRVPISIKVIFVHPSDDRGFKIEGIGIIAKTTASRTIHKRLDLEGMPSKIQGDFATVQFQDMFPSARNIEKSRLRTTSGICGKINKATDTIESGKAFTAKLDRKVNMNEKVMLKSWDTMVAPRDYQVTKNLLSDKSSLEHRVDHLLLEIKMLIGTEVKRSTQKWRMRSPSAKKRWDYLSSHLKRYMEKLYSTWRNSCTRINLQDSCGPLHKEN